jgi:hypothetical protein
MGVKDDEVKVLQMGKQLFGEMFGILTSTPQCPPTVILDPKEGYNMALTKSGSGMSTEYTAKIWMKPTEFDEEWFSVDNIPDIVEMTKKKLKPNDYLRAVIRNFLYGEDAPQDESGQEEQKPVLRKITPPKKKGRSLLQDLKK